MKGLPKIIGVVIVIAILSIGFLVWQKSQVAPASQNSSKPPAIKKVDLSTQPVWVQSLNVTATKGRSANSLDNVKISAVGFPAGMVSTLSYVLQYQTTNKGTQGALSTTPIKINGTTNWSQTIDLGTCSTKSCVRHDGVTSIDVELDFTTSSGDQPVWTKTLPL